MKKDLFKDIDNEAVKMIVENCCHHEAQEIERMLRKQNNIIIEKIYYELMYDENGEETDFIPLGCKYSQMEKILLSLGGKKETFGERTKRRVRQQLRDFENKIAEYEKKLKSLENEYLVKQNDKKLKRQNLFPNNQLKIDFLKQRSIMMSKNLKYLNQTEKQIALIEIKKLKDIIKHATNKDQ